MIWFGLVYLFNGLSSLKGYSISKLFYKKNNSGTIYHMVGGDKGVYIFAKSICSKVNMIAWLEFERAYYDVHLSVHQVKSPIKIIYIYIYIYIYIIFYLLHSISILRVNTIFVNIIFIFKNNLENDEKFLNKYKMIYFWYLKKCSSHLCI